MKHRILYIIIGLLSVFDFNSEIYAQDSAVVSVLNKYNIQSDNDTIAFDALYDTTWRLLDFNLVDIPPLLNAMKYYAFNTTLETKKPVFEGLYYNCCGKYNYLSGNTDSAIFCFETSINSLLGDTLDDRSDLSTNIYLPSFYNNLALIYDEFGLYNNAIDLQLKSILEIEKIMVLDSNDEVFRTLYATDYVELGIIYSDFDDTIEATKAFTKGIELCKQTNDEEVIAYSKVNYAVYLFDLEQYDESIKYFNESKEYYSSVNDISSLLIIRANEGVYEEKKGNFKKAKSILKSVIQTADSIGFFGIRYKVMGELFLINFDEGNYSIAEEIGNDYLKNNKNVLSDSYSTMLMNMAQLYKKTNRLNLAYNYINRSKVLDDSLSKSDNVFISHLLNTRFELDKINSRNALLANKNIFLEHLLSKQRIISILGYILVLVVGSVAVMFFIVYKKKSQLNKEIARTNYLLNQKSKDLEDSNNTLERIFSVISHDLKGPLGTVGAFIDLLNDKSVEIDDIQKDKYLNTINQSLKSSNNMLESLLHWSRKRIGKKAHFEDFDLNILVKSIIENIELTTFTKNISFKNNVPLNTVLRSDIDFLRVIIRNIIMNSVKYTNANGKIEISYSDDDDKQKIIITDNGVGMEESLLENILSGKFFKSSQGTESEKGTGLGLLICFELAESIDVNIDIKSQLDKGTTFILELG